MIVRKASLFALAVWLVPAALAVEPPRLETVTFRIHSNPLDPDSPLKMQIELLLKGEQIVESTIAWRVARLELRRPIDGGWQIWADEDPHVASVDGLWWVMHADPQSPKPAEFCLPPALDGVAVAVGSLDDLLSYSVSSHEYTAPPQGPPWPVTAALSYSFLDAAAAPVVEPGISEPSEVGGADPVGEE